MLNRKIGIIGFLIWSFRGYVDDIFREGLEWKLAMLEVMYRIYF